jgi:hypothetical protein
MEHCSQERPSAMTSDPASRFPRTLIVAGAAVAERSGDAPTRAGMPADNLDARTLPTHAARAWEPNDGPTPALPLVAGGPTA